MGGHSHRLVDIPVSNNFDRLIQILQVTLPVQLFRGNAITRSEIVQRRFMGNPLINGNCPPSNPGRTFLPERDFWPFMPFPLVLPWPAASPRPILFLGFLAPFEGTNWCSIMGLTP